ncbi:MAG: thiamine pyrophosphate-dependent dehydrogenase E1 component subunit alpha [Methylococcaceae bacterium]|jgi:pyruvate dehydrogenase E1 component alpha subunit
MDLKLKKKLYYGMLRVRRIEEAIGEHYREQEMRCPVHLAMGQEAIAVGVCANLNTTDYIMSTHRSHLHYLAKGGDIKAMLAEIYGKSTGCSSGKGGSQHLIDIEAGFLGATPIVGSIIPVAVGVAFGVSMKNEERVVVVFFGDAAVEEGVFSESLNFASLKKLKIIFVCENNLYSVYTHIRERQPINRSNVDIAKAHGVCGFETDGNDVIEVYESMSRTIEGVRKGLGPAFVEYKTYRWREHCGPNFDNNIGYRTEAEYLEWRKHCPIENLEILLKKEGILSDTEVAGMENKIAAEIEDAFHFAKSSPFPFKEELYLNLYAD